MTRAATLFLAAATSLVTIVVVVGFVLIPSPSEQRVFDLDAKRVDSLMLLGLAISSYARNHGALPQSLGDVVDANETARTNATDVETMRPYEYVKGDDFHYQLCATFRAPTQRGTFADFRHPAGRYCVSKSAKPNA